MLLIAARHARSPLRPQPQPAATCRSSIRKAASARTARRPRRYASAQAGRARRRKAQKLNELPPTPTFMAVYRRIGGCEAPIIVEYRSVSAAKFSIEPKGDSACHAHQRFCSRSSLCDLLRDLPLSDRLRRRSSASPSDGRRRTAARRVAAAVVIDVALIALFGLQHSVMARPGLQARLDAGSCRRRSSAASMCWPQASR